MIDILHLQRCLVQSTLPRTLLVMNNGGPYGNASHGTAPLQAAKWGKRSHSRYLGPHVAFAQQTTNIVNNPLASERLLVSF